MFRHSLMSLILTASIAVAQSPAPISVCNGATAWNPNHFSLSLWDEKQLSGGWVNLGIGILPEFSKSAQMTNWSGIDLYGTTPIYRVEVLPGMPNIDEKALERLTLGGQTIESVKAKLLSNAKSWPNYTIERAPNSWIDRTKLPAVEGVDWSKTKFAWEK